MPKNFTGSYSKTKLKLEQDLLSVDLIESSCIHGGQVMCRRCGKKKIQPLIECANCSYRYLGETRCPQCKLGIVRRIVDQKEGT